jgi:hypothetical protein
MKTIKVLHIMRALNIGFDSVNKNFLYFGIELKSPNDIVYDSDFKRVKRLIKSGKEITHFNPKNRKCSVIEDRSIDDLFHKSNRHSKQICDLALGKNVFKNRKPTIKKYSRSSVSTIFSDIEAFSVCQGLEDSHSRKIAELYFNNKHSEANFLEAHIIAMNVLDKYGEEMLSYCIGLPKLPFKAIDAQQIFSELDNSRSFLPTPTLRFHYKGEKGVKETVTVSFYSKKNRSKVRVRYSNILVIRNDKTNKELMKVSRDGFILPSSKAKEIVPVIQLFVRVSKNTKKYILSYGLEIGNCSICGRKLKKPDSVKRGIGSTCYSYLTN